MKVYFDTNIWIDFFLITKLSDEKFLPPRLKKSKEIQNAFRKDYFEVLSTIWSLYEFKDVLEKLRTNEKLMNLGYEAIDFREAKKENPLTKEERQKLLKLVTELMEMTKYVPPKDIDLNLTTITKLTYYEISTFDAILLFCADKLKCDYFVTGDSFLVDTINNNPNISKLLKNVVVIKRNPFLIKLSQENNKNFKKK